MSVTNKVYEWVRILDGVPREKLVFSRLKGANGKVFYSMQAENDTWNAWRKSHEKIVKHESGPLELSLRFFGNNLNSLPAPIASDYHSAAKADIFKEYADVLIAAVKRTYQDKVRRALVSCRYIPELHVLLFRIRKLPKTKESIYAAATTATKRCQPHWYGVIDTVDGMQGLDYNCPVDLFENDFDSGVYAVLSHRSAG